MNPLEIINALIKILGEATTLGQAADWIAVEENAQELRAEGHENDPQP